MGYYTDYDLEVQGSKEDIEKFDEDIESYNIEFVSGYGKVQAVLEGEFKEVKWYEHDGDMVTLSEKYPNLLFILNGVGEEFPDFWRKYYKNGKFVEVRGEVTFSDPDLTSLG